MEALVEDTLEVRLDLQLFELACVWLRGLRFIAIGEHLNQKLGKHLQHLTFYMHVIVQIIISLLSELDLLEVYLDSNVTNVDIL